MPVTETVKTLPSGQVAAIVRPMVRRNLDPKMRGAAAAVRRAAPVGETGRLRSAVALTVRDSRGRFTSGAGLGPAVASFTISVRVPYAGFVVRGTRAHRIVSHGNYPLRNRRSGRVFGRAVNHPGARANDFITPAMKQAGF